MAKLILLGYGRMGRIVESVALERGHEIVGRIGRKEAADPHTLEALLRTAEVAVEFSQPQVAEGLCRTALKHGVATVSGTTGWSVAALKAEIAAEPQACGGFLHATNLSVGVQVVFAINRLLARALGPVGYDVSLTESHHVHKVDAPSGTAITLAEGILAEIPTLDAWVLAKAGSSAHTGDEDASPDSLPIHSVREGEVFGIHEVAFDSAVDRVTLRHEAKNRRGFALGAVLAAEYLLGRRGVHSMAEVLGLDRLNSPG